MKRRSFLLGIGSALAAPAIVRAESLMKIARLRDSAAVIGLPYAEGLDDYEEGSWNPSVLWSGQLLDPSLTPAGRYVRVGRTVVATLTTNPQSPDQVRVLSL